MVFSPPSWVPKLPHVPDDVPLCDFMLDERYGRCSLGLSRPPFTCAISGRSYSALEVADRVDHLASAIAKEFGWHPNQGSEWDKVVGIFSLNAVDVIPLGWAIHRLSGIVSSANATSSPRELAYQLVNSKAKALFTCLPLLSIALEAAAKANIPRSRICLLDLPEELLKAPSTFKTVSQLISQGGLLPKVERLKWSPGQAAHTTAFICYSSGTSGLPKGVMISHRNVIANVIQISAFDKEFRQSHKAPGQETTSEVGLGLLPMSHIYALVVSHYGVYNGDEIIILHKFEMGLFLSAIQNYKIKTLYVVPPLLIAMLRSKAICDQYDLSSVRSIITGAAPFGSETATEVQKAYPKWIIRQGYGLTETCTVASLTPYNDIWHGSSGSLIPGVEARILSPEGKEITAYDEPGELVIRSPSVVLGYLNNEKATRESFKDGWMHTGDEAVFRLNPKNTEHIFIVDRIKELIKVKGFQVAPAELEAHLLAHPAVADCAVIGVPDELAGEVPKAYIVKSPDAGPDEAATAQSILKHVEDHKARHKRLKGGITFIDVVPKSPSGKILRRILRDQAREAARKPGVKL